MRVLVILAFAMLANQMNLATIQGQDGWFLLPDRTTLSNGQTPNSTYFNPIDTPPKIVSAPLPQTSFQVPVPTSLTRPADTKDKNGLLAPHANEQADAWPDRDFVIDTFDAVKSESSRKRHLGKPVVEMSEETLAQTFIEDSNGPVAAPRPSPIYSAAPYIPSARIAKAPVVDSHFRVTSTADDWVVFPITKVVFDTSNICDEWKGFCGCKKLPYDCECGGLNSNQCGHRSKSRHHNKHKCTKKNGSACTDSACRKKHSAKKKRYAKHNSARSANGYLSHEPVTRFSFFTINVNNYDD